MKLRLTNVTVRHPAARAGAPAALHGLDLAVAQGEQLAVIGPSGAGKTTLLQLLACAQRPAAGSLQLDDTDPWALPRGALQRLRGRLFLAPQVPPLPHESLWASVRSLVHPTDTALAEHALARFDVADKLFDRVDRLSGGERQRVGLARALASEASLLLVDEPLSALDPARAQQALASLTQAARERGATLVATLHHVDMALANFPRVIGLRAGALAFDLPAAQVTPALLHQLYAQHLEELAQTAPPAPDAPVAAAPVPMQCR